MQSVVQEVNNFTPIIDQNGGDPWLIEKDGYYYYTKTTGNNVTLWRSMELSTAPNGEKKVIFSIPAGFESIWAPELHYIEDAWVVYLAVNKPGKKHLMYGLRNTSKNPYEGIWEFSPVLNMDENFAIDGTWLKAGNRQYLIWSGCPQPDAGAPQYLYIAELAAWNEIKDKKILLSKPEYLFEVRQNAPINEGPEIQVHNGKVNLVYSASPSWENGYCLGLLTADENADLLEPKNWKKAKTPILDATSGIQSPGHNGFVTTKDGKEHWIIYHAARWSHSGFRRSIRLQPFWFNEKDEIEIFQSRPLESDLLQALPSGDTLRQRIVAEDLSEKENLIFEEAAFEKSAVKIVEKMSFTLPEELKKAVSLMLFVKIDQRESQDVTISLKDEKKAYKIIPSDFYQPLYFNLPKNIDELVLTVESPEPVFLDRIEGILGE